MRFPLRVFEVPRTPPPVEPGRKLTPGRELTGLGLAVEVVGHDQARAAVTQLMAARGRTLRSMSFSPGPSGDEITVVVYGG